MKKLTSFALLTLALAFVSCEQRSEHKDKSPFSRDLEHDSSSPRILEIETEEETPDEIDIEDDEYEIEPNDSSPIENGPEVRIDSPTRTQTRTAPANRDELRQSWKDAKEMLQRENGSPNNRAIIRQSNGHRESFQNGNQSGNNYNW